MKKTIVITHELENKYIDMIQSVIPDWDLISTGNRQIWQKHINQAEIVFGWKKKMVDHLDFHHNKLKWIQTYSAGVDSLPLQKLQGANIMLTSANGVHAFPISETIFALMLGLTRNIHQYVRNQQQKKWDGCDLNLELHHKTIGILGVGSIGKETAKIAKAFGMHVIGVRSSTSVTDYVDELYTLADLSLLLPKCDYIVVTLPLTENTYHLFQEKQFQLMKNSAFFINIGRGAIVKEQALLHALQTGEIAGAGLDVFEQEPLDETSLLWEQDNVIITPHTSGSTMYYDQRVVEDIFIPNLKQYIQGETPTVNYVHYKQGY